MWRNFFKFLGIILAIIILGALVLLGIQYVRYRKSPEYKAAVDLKNLEKQYADDPYGGNTPEETLRLFIDALKKGDTELAAKYFVLDKQGQWREDLGKIKEKNLINSMMADLGKTKLTIDGDVASFTLVRQDDLSSELIMHRNSANGRWKITEL